MKIIIEADGQRRFINNQFKMFVDKETLHELYKATKKAIDGKMVQGWVEVGDSLDSDETLYDWVSSLEEEPCYPWSTKK